MTEKKRGGHPTPHPEEPEPMRPEPEEPIQEYEPSMERPPGRPIPRRSPTPASADEGGDVTL